MIEDRFEDSVKMVCRIYADGVKGVRESNSALYLRERAQ
jgi:hypothetical protein